MVHSFLYELCCRIRKSNACLGHGELIPLHLVALGLPAPTPINLRTLVAAHNLLSLSSISSSPQHLLTIPSKQCLEYKK